MTKKYYAHDWSHEPRRPYVPKDKATTSRVMSKIRSKNSRAELALRRELWHRGLRYRLHQRELVGCPDLVFAASRVVVFVDSDYWHGRAVREHGAAAVTTIIRGERSSWWGDKFARTIARDIDVSKSLTNDGWLVLRYWESDILTQTKKVADAAEAAIRLRL